MTKITAAQLAEDLLFIGDDGHAMFTNDMYLDELSVDDIEIVVEVAIKTMIETEDHEISEGLLIEKERKYGYYALNMFNKNEKYRKAVLEICTTEYLSSLEEYIRERKLEDGNY